MITINKHESVDEEVGLIKFKNALKNNDLESNTDDDSRILRLGELFSSPAEFAVK